MRIALISRAEETHQLLRRAARAQGAEVCCWLKQVEGALARFSRDPPDLLVLEVGAIGGGALQATRLFAERVTSPVLLVAHAGGQRMEEVAECLAAGATDVAVLPSAPTAEDGAHVDALAAKIRTMQRLSRSQPPAAIPSVLQRVGARRRRPLLVAIGASTGGPQALAEILTLLPKPCPAAIVVAIHMGEAFVPELASWLSATTGIRAQVAQRGQRPEAGRVCIAGTDDHLVMRADGSLDYTRQPIDAPYRPSIDVLFESLAAQYRDSGVAVLLTGMGRDGASGMLSLRRRGWSTIAQDETTSTVYGMPRAAAEIGAASSILGPEGICAAISAAIDERAGRVLHAFDSSH